MIYHFHRTIAYCCWGTPCTTATHMHVLGFPGCSESAIDAFFLYIMARRLGRSICNVVRIGMDIGDVYKTPSQRRKWSFSVWVVCPQKVKGNRIDNQD